MRSVLFSLWAILIIIVFSRPTFPFMYWWLDPSYGTFNNLVSFAAIKPHTATSRAVINLDALSLHHVEFGAINWTTHALSSPLLSCLCCAS